MSFVHYSFMQHFAVSQMPEMAVVCYYINCTIAHHTQSVGQSLQYCIIFA